MRGQWDVLIALSTLGCALVVIAVVIYFLTRK